MKIKNIKSYTLAIKPTIVAIFLVLVLPIFIAIISFTYISNKKMTIESAVKSVEKSQEILKLKVKDFILPGKIAALSIAEIGSTNPQYILNNKSSQFLLTYLKSSDNILSVDVGFADGSFRSLKRVTPGDEIQGKKVPAGAVYTKRWIDKASEGASIYHYVYYDKNDVEIGSSSSEKPYIPKGRGWYKLALKEGKLAFTDPYVKASSGTGISVVAPFYNDEKVLGVVAIDIRLESLGSLLKDLTSSDNAINLLLDESGSVIVSSNPKFSPNVVDEEIIPLSLQSLDSKLPSLALIYSPNKSSFPFTFSDLERNIDYIATINEMPPEFSKKWQILMISPINDFAELLVKNNELIINVGVLGLLAQVLIIIYAAGYISKPLSVLTSEIQALIDFRPTNAISYSKRISEISLLSESLNSLKNTIYAFTSYIPRDLVNDLLKSGRDLKIGGESKYLTILFTDLKDFSTISETTPVRELLRKVSSYLELVTYAVKEERGTVDKFIGDAVMAFWGAPREDEYHAFHACVTAVKSQRRMSLLNQKEISADPKSQPLTIRIGLHCDAVLVGNIGSKERLSYTVMGDGVNVASRLEGINKEYGTSICVSHSIFKEAGERLWLRPIDKITVKGRRGEILIYELMGIRDGDDETNASTDDQELCRLTTDAYAHFVSKNFKEAKLAYQNIITLRDDKLSKVMFEKCEEAFSNAIT